MKNYSPLNLEESWKLHPALMASYVTEGSFVRYKHIEKISNLVAQAIYSGKARIILSAPPRHGKSFLMSRWVPTWFLSHWPEQHVILASYEAAFAAHWGRQVRNILQENPILGVSIAQDSHAADRWNTTLGGGMFTAGVGGPLTGRGANCLVGGSKIKTNTSCYKDISEIKPGEYVESFNHRSGKKEFKKVIATRKLRSSELVRIKTAGGLELSTTREHPIYNDQSGYKQAHLFRPGDGLVSSEVQKEQVLSGVQKTSIKIKSSHLQEMLFQNSKGRLKSGMCFLQKAVSKSALRIRKISETRAQRFLLLFKMLTKASLNQKQKKVHYLLRPFKSQKFRFLFKRMLTERKAKQIFGAFQKVKTFNLAKRFKSLLRLLWDRKNMCPSYRPQSDEQSDRKSDNPMYPMPLEASRIGRDSVSSIEEFGHGEVDVYDIQVEENHNFFANGILVHNCLIIDDYVKNAEEAYSPTYRRRAVEWWNTTFSTRAEPGASIIILATRWHEDDLIGHLTSDENANRKEWTVINLPAVCDDPNDFLGRKIGDPLCPERFDIEALDKIKQNDMTTWSALYQGQPIPPSGNIFKTDMFQFAEMPVEFQYSFIMADTAYSDKQENDFTVFTAFGVNHDQLYILDVWRKQVKASEIENHCVPFIQRHSNYNFRGAYIEPKGHGIYLNQMLPRKGVRIPGEAEIKDFFSDRKFDKVMRANNAAPHLAYRQVLINKNIPDKELLLAEVLSFPKTRFDDFTDTVIDGIKYTYGRKLSLFDIL